MSDDTAAEAASGLPHADDQGGVGILQLAEEIDGVLTIRRFRAYMHGLGAIGEAGYFRVNETETWEPAGVDWIQRTAEGAVYCIHRR